MSTEFQEEGARLLQAMSAVLKAKGVKHAAGPPKAYFEVVTPDGGGGHSDRYIYKAFCSGGPKDEEVADPGAENFDELLKGVVVSFAAWLQPRRSLLWRISPEVTRRDDRWFAYYRCAQIKDDSDILFIRWDL